MGIVALVDCNAFFCSCERVFKPHLREKPVVVLSSNDGCLIALSAEAKALGLKMSEPFFKVKHLIDKHQVHVFSSNYMLYAHMSRRVMATLEALVPALEVYSIDEAFLDFSHVPENDRTKEARRIQQIVLQHTGIPVSIGVAPTKTLAKVANRLAKTHPQWNGVLDLSRPQEVERFLPFVWCEDVWGIGRASAPKLSKYGIRTAADLAEADPYLIKKLMGIVGTRLVSELKGEKSFSLASSPAPAKSIICSRSFGRPLSQKDEVKRALLYHVTRGGAKLRRKKRQARHLTIYLRGNRFSQKETYVSRTAAVQLPLATHYTPTLLAAADHLFEKVWQEGALYAKAGMMLTDLTPEALHPTTLFDRRPHQKEKALMTTLDALNKRYGTGTLGFASQLQKENLWRAREALKSPNYLTRWDELLTVR